MKPYTPFADNSFNIQFTAFALSEILRYGLGYQVRTNDFAQDEIVDGALVKEATDQPVIIDNDGVAIGYQRELCWSLEDKQNLIDAIYNYTDIGKFVVIRNGYEKLRQLIKLGHTQSLAFHELVDGKQRLNCILDFMQDKFEDSNGFKFSDLDMIEKRKFWSYNKCTIAIINDATPSQVKRAFLNVNHTGKPMSKEHIEFVKLINV